MNKSGPAGPGQADPSGPAGLMLNAALQSMPQGFSIWTDDARLILWNQRYLDIYDMPSAAFHAGMSLAEVCAITVGVGNHPGVSADELTALYLRRLRDCTDPAVTDVYEKAIRDRVVKTSYRRSPGLGYVVIHEDVTAERMRENELRARTRMLDLALATMPCGFSMRDGDLRLVLANPRYARLYGLDQASVRPGMTLADTLFASIEAGNHPGRTAAELTAVHTARLRSLPAGRSIASEEVVGSGRVVKVTQVRTEDGGFVATHEDVTEEKDRIQAIEQRESELQTQNMRFKAAINNMSQGLCMFDREGRLIVCNTRYAEIYALPPELTLPGTTIDAIVRHRLDHGLIPEAEAPAYVQRRLEAISEGKDASDTIDLADGRIIQVLHHPMPDGGWVATHQDITEQRRAEARIRHLARHDALTDLPNRLLFRERMEAAERRIRNGESIAVLIVDLDLFKTVNDVYGHAAGDGLLCEVARRLKEACRDGDVVARLGGDEFAVLQGRLASPEDASSLADRIVKAMARPFAIGQQQATIGASVGIAVAPGDGSTAETLLKNADLALYRAKGDGRGAYHFFEPGMDARLQERLAFEIDLRAAFFRGELSLVYQPQFSLGENRISGFEALLRWQHPVRGLITPDRIIPVAEESGLIVQIGEWVLRTACRTAACWPEPVRVSVNLSAVQFRHRDLADHVARALRESGLRPGRLELELTESALLADNERTLKTLHVMRQLGVRISMDDFGTGYSSLSYLRSFPFDRIKIDQSFVSEAAHRRESLAVIKAVISLGRSLGISTTAEGIETTDQLDLVRAEGCSEIQGFLLSPPLPESAVGPLIESSGGGIAKDGHLAAS